MLFPSDESHRLHDIHIYIYSDLIGRRLLGMYTHTDIIYAYIYIQAATILRPPVAWRLYIYMCIYICIYVYKEQATIVAAFRWARQVADPEGRLF